MQHGRKPSTWGRTSAYAPLGGTSKPALPYILGASVLLSALILLSFHHSSPALKGALQYAFDHSPEITFGPSHPSSLSCQSNPFSTPGFLTSSETNLSHNRWNPTAPECTTPQLSQNVRERDPELEWMRGRTILVFGNSVDRYRVEDFCEIIGGEYTIILWDDPLAPPNVELEFPVDLIHGTGRRPRTCYVKEYDFMMVSMFQYGLDGVDFWRENWKGFDPPGLFENRLNQLLVPFLELLARPGGLSPDLVEIAAFEWDVAYWLQQEKYAPRPYVNGNTPEGADAMYEDIVATLVPAFAIRLAEAAAAVHETFPIRAPILWRMPQDYTGRGPPAAQLRQVVDQVTRGVLGSDPRIEFDETGPMLNGASVTGWMRDRTHPAKVPQAYVWSDYILFKLRQSVLGA